MAKGRGNARLGLVIGITILCLLALSETTFGAVYTVGGKGGWSFNVKNWPRGKSFRAGDALVFNYAKSLHNVVAVDKRSYDTCRSSGRPRVYRSGRDRLGLRKGHNYFICTIPGHCQAGMKIDVYAA